MMGEGLATLLGLFYGMAAGPSNAGNREDGKICTAQPGECRYNSRYYSMGMRDAKSWSDPCADDTCDSRCPYLRGTPRDMGDEPERRERACDLVDGMCQKDEADRAMGALALGMMGLDPRDILDE
jgi:hypothetical protein